MLPTSPVPATTASALRRSNKLVRTVFGYGLLAVSALVGLYFIDRDALKYLGGSPTVYQRFWPQRWLLAPHVVTAGLAFVIGPLQFVRPIRRRWPTFHRAMGWTYVICGLIGAPLAFQLSTFSTCAMCIPPFVIWSVLWFIATVLAIVMAVRKDFEAHRQFMLRSYVLLSGFVFVRLDTHIPYPLPQGLGVDRASMIIWIAWVIPLLVLEMWLSWAPLAIGRRLPSVNPPSRDGAAIDKAT